jgi:hypothetical protein
MHQVQHHPKIDSLAVPVSFSSLGGCGTQLSTFPQLQDNQWIECQLLLRLPANWPPPGTSLISLNHSLQVQLQSGSVTAAECISQFTRSRHPSASPHSLDHGLPVYLQTQLLTASKSISQFTWSQLPSASPNYRNDDLERHCEGATLGE